MREEPQESGRLKIVPRWFFALSLTMLVLNLTLLALGRGSYVAGYELLSTASALLSLENVGLWRSTFEFFDRSRSFFWWNSTHSVLFSIPPALLQKLYPWLYWPQLFHFLVCSVAIFWGLRALGLSPKLFIALVPTSATFLSFLLVGYPYLSGILPYIVLLILVLRKGAEQRSLPGYLVDLLALFFAYELAFHCYELGKTAFVVPIIGALALTRIPSSRRALWLAAGLAGAYAVYSFGRNNVEIATEDFGAKLLQMPLGVGRLLSHIYFSWYPDYPILFTLGVIALFLIRERRAFFTLLFLSQFGLLVLATVQHDTPLFPSSYIIPRRFLLMLFVCALLTAAAWREQLTKPIRASLISLIIFGQLVSTFNTVNFFRAPPDSVSLPFTQSRLDFYLNKGLIRDATILADYIRETPGEHFVFYDFDLRDEELRDPQAFPERLLLSLGYTLFRERVRLVADRPCRYFCWPIASAEQLFNRMRDNPAPVYVHIHRDRLEFPIPKTLRTSGIRAPLNLSLTNFESMKLEGLVPQANHFKATAAAPQVTTPADSLCVNLIRPIPISTAAKRVLEETIGGISFHAPLPLDYQAEQPLSLLARGTLLVGAGPPLTVRIEAERDDELLLIVDGQVVLSSLPGPQAAARESQSIILDSGAHSLVLAYTNYFRGQLKLRLEPTEPLRLRVSCQTAGPTLPTLQPAVRYDPNAPKGSLCERVLPMEPLSLEAITTDDANFSTRPMPLIVGDAKPISRRLKGRFQLASATPVLSFFDLIADDEAILRLNGEIVLKKIGVYGTHLLSASTFLQPGENKIEIAYTNLASGGQLRFLSTLENGQDILWECPTQK